MLNHKLFVIWCLVIGISGCQQRQLYRDTQVLLGTFVEVISPDRNAAKVAFDEIRRIEGLLSKYKKDSEVSRLNQASELRLSPETFYVLKKAADFYVLTDGAFDVTVGPLMDLWGFTDKKYNLPKADKIKETLKVIGTNKIIFDEANNMVKFFLPGMKIDLGGIAKGYAVDCAVRRMKAQGIKSALVNAGGQVYCLGDKFGKPWKVAVKDPRKKNPAGYLSLKDRAVSTSGDYEQYFIAHGKRYSHIMDPRTGYPAESGIAAVTVIASDSLTADALSTSVFVMGRDNGQKLIKKIPQVEIRIAESKEKK